MAMNPFPYSRSFAFIRGFPSKPRLPLKQLAQRLHRRQRVQVERLDLVQQRVRLREQRDLLGLGSVEVNRAATGGLQLLHDLLCAVDDGTRQPRRSEEHTS